MATVFKEKIAGLEGIRLKGKPSHPLDSIYLTLFLLGSQKHFFSPGYNAPIFTTHEFVFTICDLNHVDVPSNSSISKRLYYDIVMQWNAKRAFRVLTISDFSRRRIIDYFSLDADRVINIGVGVDKRFSVDGDIARPGFRYALCISNRKPHKNEIRLLKAFAMASVPTDIKLVFSGVISNELSIEIDRLNIKDRVVFNGYIAEEVLPIWYRGALAVFFPSLYEGFGLPAVEGMACGTPVLTSNVTSLPEIVGGAALLVDPYDVNAISKGIESIINDGGLSNSLRELGPIQASQYTWERVMNKVSRVLTELSEIRS
jgi:glycosyltransferase involved in cell wall biosynthesis